MKAEVTYGSGNGSTNNASTAISHSPEGAKGEVTPYSLLGIMVCTVVNGWKGLGLGLTEYGGGHAVELN